MADKSILEDARTLALFSNLADPKDAEYFRHNYPGFVPPAWWTVEYSNNLIWNLWQQLLQESWTELSFDRIVALLIQWSSTSGASQSVVHGVNIPTAYPYQRAVMFLAMEQWRAKFCEQCGKRFVKEKPPQRFCSDVCFNEARKAYKRALWAEHGSQWLENRSKRKSKQTKKQRR